jgi:hypothetical protein
VQINDALSLVIPLRRDAEGNPLTYAFHTPIPREVFEANYQILAGTKSAIFMKGLAYAGDVGPRIATLELKEQAKKLSLERGDLSPNGEPNTVSATALLAEIKRLTLVLIPTLAGWENVPVDVAMQQDAIDADDWREAESGLVFFTCAYALTPKAQRRNMADGIASILPGSITSLPPTEFAVSLAKSKLERDEAQAKAASSDQSSITLPEKDSATSQKWPT